MLVETRHPNPRAVLWSPTAVTVLLLPDGSEQGGATDMSADGRIISGNAATAEVLWVDRKAYWLRRLIEEAGVDLTDVGLGSPNVLSDGRTLHGRGSVKGEARAWLARLTLD